VQTERLEVEQVALIQPGLRECRSAFPPFGGTEDSAGEHRAPPGHLEVRLYDDLPCIPMYIQKRGGVPIRGFTGYFLSHASERFAHARWGFADKGMLQYFAEYFDNKWDHVKPINFSSWERAG
jgi:hypothetical protein